LGWKSFKTSTIPNPSWIVQLSDFFVNSTELKKRQIFFSQNNIQPRRFLNWVTSIKSKVSKKALKHDSFQKILVSPRSNEIIFHKNCLQNIKIFFGENHQYGAFGYLILILDIWWNKIKEFFILIFRFYFWHHMRQAKKVDRSKPKVRKVHQPRRENFSRERFLLNKNLSIWIIGMSENCWKREKSLWK